MDAHVNRTYVGSELSPSRWVAYNNSKFQWGTSWRINHTLFISSLLPIFDHNTIGQLIFKDIKFRGYSKICLKQNILWIYFQGWAVELYSLMILRIFLKFHKNPRNPWNFVSSKVSRPIVIIGLGLGSNFDSPSHKLKKTPKILFVKNLKSNYTVGYTFVFISVLLPWC